MHIANNYLTSCSLAVAMWTSSGVFAGDISPICCFPKQFESFMFAVNSGFADARGGSLGLNFGLSNGTIRTAYDSINKRTYIFTKYTMFEPDEPGSLEVNVTIVHDYKRNVQWQVFLGVLCQEGPINEDLFIECIPGDATLVGQGTLGDSTTFLQSYMLNVTLGDTDYQMVVTVTKPDKSKGECIPVRMSLADNPPDPDAGVIVADVTDVTYGIKDTSIFSKPAGCSNDTSNANFKFPFNIPFF